MRRHSLHLGFDTPLLHLLLHPAIRYRLATRMAHQRRIGCPRLLSQVAFERLHTRLREIYYPVAPPFGVFYSQPLAREVDIATLEIQQFTQSQPGMRQQKIANRVAATFRSRS